MYVPSPTQPRLPDHTWLNTWASDTHSHPSQLATTGHRSWDGKLTLLMSFMVVVAFASKRASAEGDADNPAGSSSAYLWVHVCVHVCVHVSVCGCISVRASVLGCVYMRTRARVHNAGMLRSDVRARVCGRLCVPACTRDCMRARVLTHTHIHPLTPVSIQ